MQVRIENRAEPLDGDARAVVDQFALDMEERLSEQGARETRLDVRLDGRDDGWYEAELEITIPGELDGGSGDTYNGRGLGLDPSAAMLEAVTRISAEFDDHRYQENPGEQLRVDEVQNFIATPAPPDLDEEEERHPDWDAHQRFRHEVARVAAPFLHRHAAHEIAARQLLGDLDPGWIDPMEMVDEVLAERLITIHAGDDLYKVLHGLVKRLISRIDQAVQERNIERERDVSTDQALPELPPQREVVEFGREIEDWYQPDDGMMAEDLLTGDETDDTDQGFSRPDEANEAWEERRRLLEALFREPEEARRLFALHVLEDWSIDTVASATGCPVEQVQTKVREVAESLATTLRLAEADDTLEAEDALRMFRTIGEELRSRHGAETRSAERPVIPPVVVDGDEDRDIEDYEGDDLEDRGAA